MRLKPWVSAHPVAPQVLYSPVTPSKVLVLAGGSPGWKPSTWIFRGRWHHWSGQPKCILHLVILSSRAPRMFPPQRAVALQSTTLVLALPTQLLRKDNH